MPIVKQCRNCGKEFSVRPSYTDKKCCTRWCAKAIGPETKPAPVRFWAKVDKCGPVPAHMPHLGPCWLWRGATARGGYGHFGERGVKRDPLWTPAHRFAWRDTYGPIPDDLWVLHRCDNPPCVRPEHLFVGTVKDNASDMISKGRARLIDANYTRRRGIVPARGIKHGMVKLTERDVLKIRAEYASGAGSYSELARKFGVSWSNIGLIVNRRNWKHI